MILKTLSVSGYEEVVSGYQEVGSSNYLVLKGLISFPAIVHHVHFSYFFVTVI